MEYKYDTQLLIEGEGLDEDEINDYFQEHFQGDCLLAVGELAEHIYKAAQEAHVADAFWCRTKEEAKPILEQLVRPNATILVKASRGMAFEELVEYLKSITAEP